VNRGARCRAPRPEARLTTEVTEVAEPDDAPASSKRRAWKVAGLVAAWRTCRCWVVCRSRRVQGAATAAGGDVAARWIAGGARCCLAPPAAVVPTHACPRYGCACGGCACGGCACALYRPSRHVIPRAACRLRTGTAHNAGQAASSPARRAPRAARRASWRPSRRSRAKDLPRRPSSVEAPHAVVSSPPARPAHAPPCRRRQREATGRRSMSM